MTPGAVRAARDRAVVALTGSGMAPDVLRIARNGEKAALEGQKAGGVRQHAPGKTGYFTESGVEAEGLAVSGAGGFGAAFRDLPRNGLIPNSISFSLSFP